MTDRTPRAKGFPKKNLNSDDHFDRSFAPYRDESQTTKPKKGTINESINSVQKIRILPLLIVSALVAFAAFTAAPATATPACALASQTLALGHFSNGLLNLKCNEFDAYGWFLKMNVKGDSDLYVIRNTWPVGAHIRVAHASRAKPDHGFIWRAHRI